MFSVSDLFSSTMQCSLVFFLSFVLLTLNSQSVHGLGHLFLLKEIFIFLASLSLSHRSDVLCVSHISAKCRSKTMVMTRSRGLCFVCFAFCMHYMKPDLCQPTLSTSALRLFLCLCECQCMRVRACVRECFHS